MVRNDNFMQQRLNHTFWDFKSWSLLIEARVVKRGHSCLHLSYGVHGDHAK